jgi:GT2 family glycosyltransferase
MNIKHAVTMLAYNQVPQQLELTKEAVESVFAQDIGPIDFYFINNGSTYETRDWLKTLVAPNGHNLYVENYRENRSPVLVSNERLGSLFGRGYETVLSTANDIILPPNMYREMMRWPRGVVTGSQTEERNFPLFETSTAVNECTPMAAALLRKWFHDALVAKDGYFLDPNIFFYASDVDLALRMAACGIRGVQLDINYYHFCSGCWRMLPPEKGRLITGQADSDRDYFERRYGFKVDAPEYAQTAANINFRGVGR